MKLRKNFGIYLFLLVLVLHLLYSECDARRGGGGGRGGGGSSSRGGGGWFSRGSSRSSSSSSSRGGGWSSSGKSRSSSGSYGSSSGGSYGWNKGVIGGRNVVGTYKSFGKPSRWSIHHGRSFYYVGYPHGHYHHSGYGYGSGGYGSSEETNMWNPWVIMVLVLVGINTAGLIVWTCVYINIK